MEFREDAEYVQFILGELFSVSLSLCGAML